MRVKLFVWVCVSLLVAFVFQGCLTSADKDKGGSGGDINGKWLKVRTVSELSVGGVVTADTTEYDTSDFSKEYLSIQGSTFLQLSYDFVNEGVDTLDLQAQALGGSKWELDDGFTVDSSTFVRSGSLLKRVAYSIGGLSLWTEYVLETRAFPPAEWVPDTTGNGGGSGNGSIQTWKMLREIYTTTDSTGSVTDTFDFTVPTVEMHRYYRIYGEDSILIATVDGSFLISDNRVDATHWVEQNGDTLTVSVTGNTLAIQFTTSSEEGDVIWTNRRDFVRFTGAFPPTDWRITLPTTATTVVVDAAAITGTLDTNVTKWYSFTAQAGKEYHLYTTYTTDTLDTFIRLYNAAGDRLASNDDENPNESYNAGIVWTASAAGTYYFSVLGYDDFQVGAFKVAVDKVPTPLPKRAAVNAFPKVKPHKR
jgi:hypothetical protein